MVYVQRFLKLVDWLYRLCTGRMSRCGNCQHHEPYHYNEYPGQYDQCGRPQPERWTCNYITGEKVLRPPRDLYCELENSLGCCWHYAEKEDDNGEH